MKQYFIYMPLFICIGYIAQCQYRNNKTVNGIIKNPVVIETLIDSIRKKIITDTVKFDRRDLIHSSLLTENSRPYSALFIVNKKYAYVLDIIGGNKVMEFIDEFLKPEIINSIQMLDSNNATSVYGKRGQKVALLINMKKKSKLDFFVAGLKKSNNRKDNFDQYQAGELKMFY